MKGFLRKILCKHKNSEVICWHWTHGSNGNDIRFLEIQRKCTECGKYFFTHIKGRDECNRFVSHYPEKEWSDKCKPVL
jgi:hypothetical protein